MWQSHLGEIDIHLYVHVYIFNTSTRTSKYASKQEITQEAYLTVARIFIFIIHKSPPLRKSNKNSH